MVEFGTHLTFSYASPNIEISPSAQTQEDDLTLLTHAHIFHKSLIASRLSASLRKGTFVVNYGLVIRICDNIVLNLLYSPLCLTLFMQK